MNSELYFPRTGKSFAQTSEMDFEDTVKLLGDVDINIIYKTEINLTKDSFTEALEESAGGSEKMHLIVVADAFRNPDPEKVNAFLNRLGVESKIKKIEAPVIDLDAILEEKRKNDKVTPVMPTLKVDDAPAAEEKTAPAAADEKETEEKEARTITAYTTVYRQILVVFLPEEKTAGENFNTILYSVCKSLLKPKSKSKLWKRFIPCSGDSPFDVIRKVILMLAICTFIVSSVMLVNLLVVKPAINDSQNEQIRQMLVIDKDEVDETGKKITKKPIDGSQGTLVDFSKLIQQNDDTIGWIKVPNTMIDYVVCQAPKGEDHEYYLYRDFYKNQDSYGTVFLDYRSGIDSQNMILHGHNMRDGRMFGTLKYFEDLSFYKKNPTFTFNTIYEKSEWKIISIMKTNTLESQGEFFNYLRGNFDNSYDFLNFVYQIRERSIIDTPVTVNEDDTLVTLSTCTYDFSQFRFVVVARKVRDGESTKVDVSKAIENPDTLYPDVWYNTYGGKKPDVTTFQEAFNKKKITWYDGEKTDWSEKDDEKLLAALKTNKESAIADLKKFVDSRHYAEFEKKQINKLMEEYTKMIDSARSRTEINEIFNKAVQDIAKVKTIEDQNADKEASNQAQREKELNEKKEAAKADLNNSIEGNNYRMTQASVIKSIIEEYTKRIDNASTAEEINQALEDGIKSLKKVKTDEQLTKEESSEKAKQSSADEASRKRAAEESSRKAAQESSEAEASRKAEQERQLQEAKDNAKNEISNYVNLGNYKPAQQQEIRSIINEYSGRISSANTTAAINSYVSTAKNQMNQVKTAAQIDAETSPEPSPVEPSPVEPSPVESSPVESSPVEPPEGTSVEGE